MDLTAHVRIETRPVIAPVAGAARAGTAGVGTERGPDRPPGPPSPSPFPAPVDARPAPGVVTEAMSERTVVDFPPPPLPPAAAISVDGPIPGWVREAYRARVERGWFIPRPEPVVTGTPDTGG